MQHNFCDQEDCLLHPIYIKKEEDRKREEARIIEAKAEKKRIQEMNSLRVITDKDLTANIADGTYIYNSGNGTPMAVTSTVTFGSAHNHSIGWDNDIMSVIGQTMRIKTSTIDLPFECTICSHFKKLNIKEILIIEEAKKVLND